MKRSPYLIAFSLFALLLTACKGGKIVEESTVANKSLSAKSILNTHKAAAPQFKTLAARMQVVYETGEDLKSIAVSLRMEKDEKIWIKASLLGITLAKVYITPDSVSMYESLSNTYFEGDFSLLSTWLGTDIDFQKAQSLLLGQTLFSDEVKYQSDVVNNTYVLQPKNPDPNFLYSFSILPENFKIASEKLSQPQEQRFFNVNYKGYQKLEGSYFPSELSILTQQKEEQTKITITYKKIDPNVPIKFPFKIPKGYDKIELD